MTADTAGIPFLDLVAQHAPLKVEILRLVESALDSAAFVGGEQVVSFETEFARYIGSPHAVGLSNGTDALRLALVALGIGVDDRVATVANTFIATTEAISQVGAKFDLMDIDPDTCLMDPNRLEDYLKARFDRGSRAERPKAVIPVHLYGQCVDMDPVLALARKYELRVLEDAAQAHGATYRGRKAGTLGDAAAFSFYAGKNLGACGEGGAVTTADGALAEKIRMLREHGQSEKYHHALEGFNARLHAIQAGILRIKLPHLDRWNTRRREAAAVYDAAFAQLDWVKPAKVKTGNVSSHHLYVIHVPNRDALQANLKANGIATGLHYPVPLHLQKCYSHLGFRPGAFPNAEHSASRLLSLPMFAELGEKRACRVADTVAAFRG